MADVARWAVGSATSPRTTITAPDWPSRWVAIGLVSAFVAVGFGLPAHLPLQAASWLTFLALVIAPGYLLGDMVTWRLDLDLLERLALAMSLGVFVMALPGMVAMLGHMTIHDLATAWIFTVGCLAIAWTLFRLWPRKNSSRSNCPPWTWAEIALLLLLIAAFVYMFPTLSLYKMDGDAYAVATFTADALTGRPLNVTEPVLGTGRSLGSIRMGLNQWLPISHLWSYLSQIDHIQLTGTASRSMLALWAILASYALGKAAADGPLPERRRIGLLTASVQTLVFLAAPFFRSDHVGFFFFERINADKFTVTVTMLPVVLALAIRYVRTGQRAAWIAAALAGFALSSIHALIAAMLALALGAFGGLHLLLHLRRREAWTRVLGLAVLTSIVMILPGVQLVEARTGEGMAPTFPSSFEGWSIEQRLIPVLPFRLMPTLDVYGPLPDLAQLDAEQANTVTNPFLIWRFALNMRRQRIIVFDLKHYISDPTIILEPPYLLALLLLPILLWRLRSHLGAQFALSTTLAILLVMFNPVLTPLLGSLVMPWILWRFIWLLPYALIIALVTDRLLAGLVWLPTCLPGLRSARALLLGGASLGFVVLSALLLRPNILANIEQIHARGASSVVYATPEKLLARLKEETRRSGPVLVMADENLSVTIPAFVGNADIVAHRILSTAEMFPANQQDLALQRHIDQYNFFYTPLLTPAQLDILQRYSVRYVVVPEAGSLDSQLRLSPQWFEWLTADQGYSLYAVRQLPTTAETIQGNAAYLERQWESARQHYESALVQDPSDTLALVGMADIYRIGGQFDQALATLEQALAQVDSPVLHYRLGQVYADMGQVERSIAEFDEAQRRAPGCSQFHTALGDACLGGGDSECAQEQFEAAVDTLGLADDGQRLLALADLWQLRNYEDVALSLYEQAATIRPDGQTRLLLADLYRRTEQYGKAEEVLNALQQAYPLSADANLRLGVVSAMARLKAEEGETDQAVIFFNRALWLQALLAKDARLTHLLLAQTLLEADRLEEARSEIERVLRLQPHNASAYVLLGNLYRAQYEPTMAMAAYQYALQLDPTEAAAYTSLSDQHRQQAMPPDESLVLMQRAVEFNPEQPVLVLTLADQLWRLGDVDMAITTYQQALGWFEPNTGSLGSGLQPTARTRALAYTRLAEVYEDLGQVDTAMSYYHAAVTAAPGQAWTLVTLGDALRRRNLLAAAEDAYRAAIQGDPAQADSYVHLASLLSDRGEPAAAFELYDQAVQATLAGTNPAQTSRAWLALGSFYSQSPPPDALLGSDETLVVEADSVDPITERALTAYSQALAAEESVAGVRALAGFHQDLGQTEDAIQLFRERIQLGEQDRWVPSLLAKYYAGLGDVYLGEGQWDQAISAFRHAAGLDGWWVGAHLALARGYGEQGDQTSALAEIRRAVEIAPGFVEAQIALADALDQQGDPDQALVIYRATAQAHPGSALANLALARAWQARHHWDLAEESYHQSMAMVPGDIEAYLGLANLHRLRARYDETEALLHKAMRIDCSEVEVYLQLGDLLERQARHFEALEAYRQAAQVSPEDWQPYVGLAGVHRALGEMEHAEQYLKQAAGMENTAALPFLQLADLYQAQNQPELAEQSLLLGLERLPGQPSLRQLLAEFYQSVARTDQALQQSRLAVEENPDSMAVLASYASLLRVQGKTTQAEEVYRKAEKAGEPSALGYQALAAARQAQGQETEALALLDRAIAHDPQDVGNWIEKGRLQVQLGESVASARSRDLLAGSGAATSLERAIDFGPGEGRAWYALGDTLLAAGRTQEAVEALEQAIAVEPVYLPAYNALVEAYEELGQPEQTARIVALAKAAVPGSHLGHLLEAQALEAMQSWDAARAAVQQAIAIAPGVTESYLAMGQLEQQQGHLDEAASWYRQAIALYPGDQAAHLNLIDLLLTQGDNSGALAQTQAALEARPGDGELLLRLGRVRRILGRYAEAALTLLLAAELDPANDSLYAELALLYLAQGKFEHAIAAYSQASTLRPDQAAYHLALSQVWSSQGRPEHALSLLRNALPQTSRPAPLLAAMSALHLRRGEPALALETLEAGIPEAGEDIQLLQALGAYYQSQADLDQAEQVYHRAVALYPDEAGSHLALGGFYLGRGRAAEALAEYEQAANLDPLDGNIQLALGNAQRLMGNTEKAIAAYTQAMVLAPRLEDAYLTLASVYREQGRWQDALAVYEAGIAVAPTSERLLTEQSDLLLQRGDEDGALSLLDRATQLSSNARTYMARAALYRVLGRSADAQRDLVTALQLEPGSVEALVALSNLYRSQGNARDAEEAYRRALSLEPGTASPYTGLAELAYDRGQLDEAWWQFGAASSAEPASPDPLVGLGAARADVGDWTEAEAAYQRAVELAPGSTEAYLGLADILQRHAGSVEEAIAWLEQADGYGVNRAAIYRAIGELYRNAGQSGLTANYLQQAVQLEPSAPEGYLNLADLSLAEGLPQEAERYASLALEIAPRNPAVHITLGNVYHTLGELSTAESHYQEAIRLDATRVDGHTAVADFYVAQERYSEAVAACQEAIRSAPLDWSLWVSLGNVYVEMEKPADAHSAYAQAAEMNPSVPDPWLRRGDVYVTQKKLKKAQAAFEHAQMLRPNQSEPLLRLAALYEEREDMAKARRYARKAIEVDPASAAGYVTLGRILNTEGTTKKAAEAYLSAVQLDPRRPAAYERWIGLHIDIKRQPYSLDKTRLKTALSKLAKSDEAETVWAQVLLGLGYLNLEKDTDLVIGHLEAALRLDPAFAELNQELATAYEEDLEGRHALESWLRYLYASSRDSDTSEAQKHVDSLLQRQIEQPADGDRVSGTVKIIGTAMGKEFKSYKVQYRAAGSSGKWSTIGTKTSRVEHGTLITWKTGGLSPGEYRLRLAVVNTKGKTLPYYAISVQIQPSN